MAAGCSFLLIALSVGIHCSSAGLINTAIRDGLIKAGWWKYGNVSERSSTMTILYLTVNLIYNITFTMQHSKPHKVVKFWVLPYLSQCHFQQIYLILMIGPLCCSTDFIATTVMTHDIWMPSRTHVSTYLSDSKCTYKVINFLFF